MPKSKKENRDDDVDAAQKTKLQAVLLADPFLESFRPLTLDSPKVLCPLNNVRLLDYTLDFLATQNVEQVFVVCTNDELDLYLRNNKKKHFTMEVISFKDTSLTNAGDALRELYKRNVIQSDPFLLLFGDCITNMDLRGAMEAHTERGSKDSAAIMTVVLKEIGTSSGLQPATEDLVVGLDTSTSRVLLYENQASNKIAKLPCSFFKAHATIEVRDDLMDTGICICSPEVLGQFEDNFDYLHIANHFVHNSVAEEEEGLQARIHAHILPSETYAARVVDEATYHTISQDLLRRWCYPVVPDNNHHPSADAIQQLYKVVSQVQQPPQLFHYKECIHPSKVGRTSTICGPGMLGSGGSIEENATVDASVLGGNVYVHEGATVRQSHLWDRVEVHANATVIQAIIAQDCIIGEGATVSKGCVLGKGVVIGKGVTLPEFTRITLQKDNNNGFGEGGDWDDESMEGNDTTEHAAKYDKPDLVPVPETDHEVVGKDGMGHVWTLCNDDHETDDEDDFDLDMDVVKMQSIGYDTSSYLEKRKIYQVEDDDDGFSQTGPTEDEKMDAQAFSMMTDDAFTFEDTPTSSDPVVFGRQKGVDVVKEMKEICMEFEESSPMENLAIELNSYKFSQNAAYSDCTMASTLAMVERMEITVDMKDSKLVASLKSRLAFWAPLLQKLSMGIDEEKAIIHGLERVATAPGTPEATKLGSGLSLRFLLQTLHDEEVLSEDAILSWAADRKEESADSSLGKLFQLQSIQDFLEWLEEESEEEDSDDDDSNSD
jgi:translation initiation factor eIF-2B subunit epsilon